MVLLGFLMLNLNGISGLYTNSYLKAKLAFCNSTCFLAAGASKVKPGIFRLF